MACINGDWFHSRCSSNLEELLAVRTLVFESQKQEYIGFGWSGGREGNQKMYQLYQFEYETTLKPKSDFEIIKIERLKDD